LGRSFGTGTKSPCVACATTRAAILFMSIVVERSGIFAAGTAPCKAALGHLWAFGPLFFDGPKGRLAGDSAGLRREDGRWGGPGNPIRRAVGQGRPEMHRQGLSRPATRERFCACAALPARRKRQPPEDLEPLPQSVLPRLLVHAPASPFWTAQASDISK
jgi:hypothetical protein